LSKGGRMAVMLAWAKPGRNAGLCKARPDNAPLPLYINPARPVRVFGVGATTLSGMSRSSDGLDARRRKALLRAWRRGMRETDLIMGRFADAYVAMLSDEELAEYERLLDVRDQDLLGWVTGEFKVPADYDTALFRHLRDFHFTLGKRT